MSEEWVIASGLMGAGTAGVAYFGRPYYWHVVDYLERDLGEKLRRLRMPTHRLRRQIVLWSALLAVVFFGLWLGADSLVFAVLGAAVLSCGPWYVLRQMAETRRLKIEDQLADAMVTLSSAVKAGLSLPQALEILADQCPKPISAEFQQLMGEYQLGKPMERCLEEAKARLHSENFALFSAAIQASRQSGGRLNETIDRIARSVLELQRLERKITSETAQARKSAVYMALAPALILVVYYFVDPINTTRLFVTLPGQILLAISLVFNLLAYVWARVILHPDI
jgi:tight adherence protein B